MHRYSASDSNEVDPRRQQQQQQQQQPPPPPQSSNSNTTSSSSSHRMIFPSPSALLHGKRALVTGGSGTIGRAIAKALLRHGASVVLTGRRLEKLEEAKTELLKDLSVISPSSSSSLLSSNFPTIHVVSCDITQEEAVTDLFSEIDCLHDEEQRLLQSSSPPFTSSIDILVNNAGVNIAGSIEELTSSDMASVLGVNVTGAFLCSREAFKRMKKKSTSEDEADSRSCYGSGGRIINIGSISATSPRPNSVAYTTSKFALQGLTKSLALDGRRHNITVGIIHPGNVVSDMLSEEDVKVRGETEGFLQADDVAECVLTMASLPYSANVLELTVIPTTQPLVGRG
jgi:NAD(P)-dependent dehydrogenase (short-subunit alcohol dehydrogenase family)